MDVLRAAVTLIMRVMVLSARSAGQQRLLLLQQAIAASEYGNGINGEFGSALELARVICLDLNELQCDSWVYWQAVGNLDRPNDWHAVHVSYSRQDEIAVRKQYWALLQFTRYLRPGSVILRVAAEDVVAALRPTGGLAIVAVNRETSDRPVRFDLRDFSRLPERAQWTATTEKDNHRSNAPVPLKDGLLDVDLPPGSVNTFLVDTPSKTDT